jgi:hypothetical protein
VWFLTKLSVNVDVNCLHCDARLTESLDAELLCFDLKD